MLKKFLLSAITLMLITNVSYGKDDIRIPTKDMDYAYSLNDGAGMKTTVFNGKMLVDGKIFLSWLNLDNEPAVLNVTFAPSINSRKKLPYINDNYNEKNIEISLNTLPLNKDRVRNAEGIWQTKNASLPNNIALIKPYFPDIPATFWQRKTGSLSLPAQVTMTQFGMNIECDSRNYYATAVAIRPLGQKQSVTTVESC